MNLNYRVVFIKDSQKNEKYAKDKNGNEYYPVTGEFATDNKGKCLYARTSNNSVIFPVDENGNEFYIRDKNDEFIDPSINFRYAKRHEDQMGNIGEFYPRKTIKNPQNDFETVEYDINMYYAVDSDNQPYYPLGFSENEYFFLGGFNPPDDYPISNDGYYLTPFNEDTKEILHFKYKRFDIRQENVIETVTVFENLQHYRTNVPSGRDPRVADPFPLIYPLEDDSDSSDSENDSTDSSDDSTDIITTRPSVSASIPKIFNFAHIWIILILTFVSVILWYWNKR